MTVCEDNQSLRLHFLLSFTISTYKSDTPDNANDAVDVEWPLPSIKLLYYNSRQISGQNGSKLEIEKLLSFMIF